MIFVIISYYKGKRYFRAIPYLRANGRALITQFSMEKFTLHLLKLQSRLVRKELKLDSVQLMAIRYKLEILFSLRHLDNSSRVMRISHVSIYQSPVSSLLLLSRFVIIPAEYIWFMFKQIEVDQLKLNRIFEFNSEAYSSKANLFLFLGFSQAINDDICILSGFKHTSEEKSHSNLDSQTVSYSYTYISYTCKAKQKK